MVFNLKDKIEYVEREIEETVGRTTAWSGGATAFGSCEDLLVETLYENSGKQGDMSFNAALASYRNRKIKEKLSVEDALFFYTIRRVLYKGYEAIKQHDESAYGQALALLPDDTSPQNRELVIRYLDAARRGVAVQNPSTEPPLWYADYVREFCELTASKQ